MNIKDKKINIISLVEEQLKLKSKKHEITEEGDDPEKIDIVTLNFVSKESDIDIDMHLIFEEDPDRLDIVIPDVYDLEDVDSMKSNEIFKEVLDMNSSRLLYGRLGYASELNSITYMNSISLKGRNSLEADELKDYINYSLFITNKAKEHLNELKNKEEIKDI
ncbi:hypothetical protein [Bacillus cereus group sp. MYBK139-2]|uniref:hypothetical protein n=1 Tax=unclassified Bacillus cereus group TaxID=2750818 RepID=UPI003F79B7C1